MCRLKVFAVLDKVTPSIIFPSGLDNESYNLIGS